MKCQNILLCLSFFGASIIYSLRVNLSLAIIVMAGPTHGNDTGNFKNDCPIPKQEKLHADLYEEKAGEFDWNEKLQGKILGMFFYGYLFTNILGGRLSEKIGGKAIFGCGVGLQSLLCLMAPSVARHSVELFMLLRLFQGMISGVTFPSLSTLMAQWVPPADRSRFLARAAGGSVFGSMVTLATSGWLIARWGWPSVFYIFGSLGVVWWFFWQHFVYNSPSIHPTISSEEREHLALSVSINSTSMRLPVPWRKIMTSPPFLALVFAHFGSNWGFYTLITELPTYLSSVHHFRMRDNGLVSALPYLSVFIFSLVHSNYVDNILQKGKSSYYSMRKVSTLISLIVPSCALLLVSEAGCRSNLVILLICFGIAFHGASYSGFHCGFQELAPNYAGTLLGISNTFATLPGVLSPLITGIIINEQPTIHQWGLVFQLCAFVYFFTGFVYSRFMSVDVQPWNNPKSELEVQKRPLVKII